MSVVDEFGLVLENQHIATYIPVLRSALVFRVIERTNKDAEIFDYGPLPLTEGESLTSYDGVTAVVAEDGVIPSRAYTLYGRQFPLEDAYKETDMWWIPEDYRERVFHVHLYTTPAILRLDVQIPTNVTQGRFQRNQLDIGIHRDFGFARGHIEIVHFPEIIYGYRFGNDTNANFYTHARFVYGEYVVEIPKDPELIFNILTRKYPAHWVTMPIRTEEAKVREALLKVYGIEGFPLYGIHQKDRAIEEYKSLLERAKI